MNDRCNKTVYPQTKWGSFQGYPCRRKAWKDGFCRQHHPDSVKERQRKSEANWIKKRENDPLNVLQKEVGRLKGEVGTLKTTYNQLFDAYKRLEEERDLFKSAYIALGGDATGLPKTNAKRYDIITKKRKT